MFSENAKITSVTSMDKKTDDKNSVLNFGPISILNCFSKVYENILKTHLVEKMNVSGASQGSIVGPILFNFFFNDFFYFILVASAHNFADDNTLSSFAKTIENLISLLESLETFVMSNFNYFSLVWNFSSAKSLNKIENLQKELYASC